MTIFSPQQLDSIVATTLQNLPANHSNAIVAGVDQTGAQVVIGFQRQQGSGVWSAQGAYRHTWSGDDQVGARLMYSW